MTPTSFIRHFKKIKISHIIAFSLGVLVPIYSDMLFLHEFDSSTVSAIMDTVMATLAAMTTYHVVNWINGKIDNRGFEQADKCILFLSKAKLKARLLAGGIESIHNYLKNTGSINNDKTFEQLNSRIEEFYFDYHTFLIELESELDLLVLWKVKFRPPVDSDISEYFRHLYHFNECCSNAMNSFDEVNVISRERKCEYNMKNIKESFSLIEITHSRLELPYKYLFE